MNTQDRYHYNGSRYAFVNYEDFGRTVRVVNAKTGAEALFDTMEFIAFAERIDVRDFN